MTIVQQVSQPGHNIAIVARGHNLPPSTVQGWCKNKDELEKSSIENNGGDSKTIFMDKTPQLTVGLKAFCEQPVDCMGCSTYAGPLPTHAVRKISTYYVEINTTILK